MNGMEVLESPISNPDKSNFKLPDVSIQNVVQKTPSTQVIGEYATNVPTQISGTENRFRLRQCHVVQWPNFDGYGFIVHTLKDLPGQYIGLIEKNSPAQAAGLMKGDRIIEVNGINVEGEFHHELRRKIHAVNGQVRLLVVDAESDKYFHDNKLKLHSGQPFIDKITCPPLPHSVSETVNNSGGVLLSVDDIRSFPHRIRICHLKVLNQRQVNTPNYGFMLRTGSVDGRPGQFIAEVERGSVSERAGLKPGDRVIEVNGFNVETESHREIIERIKAVLGQTKLTVVDAETDQWLHDHQVPLLNGLPPQLITRCFDSNDDENATTILDDEDHLDIGTFVLDSSAMAADYALSHPYRPRLCNLSLSVGPRSPGTSASSSVGYGFNVHVERYRIGHFIGSVKPGSSADRAGLRTGDRVIEVNGTNVETDSHNELVERISEARKKQTDEQLKLLVIDQSADAYFREMGLKLSSDQKYVDRFLQANVSEEFTTSLPVGGQRLCKLKRKSDNGSYGFVLISEKSRPGSFVAHVEKNSPAATAGLRTGDRIFEVNGIKVEKKSHAEVAKRILSIDGSLELLVVDDSTDRFFHSHQASPLNSHQPVLERTVCPNHRVDLQAVEVQPLSSADHIQSSIRAGISASTLEKEDHNFRLCKIRKKPNFVGYGFDVVTERNQPFTEHYIGKVDAGSPAEDAGLRDGDLIITVNGVAVVEIGRCDHEQLASRIRSMPDGVNVHVADPATVRWYREHRLLLTSNLSDELATEDDQPILINDSTDREKNCERRNSEE